MIYTLGPRRVTLTGEGHYIAPGSHVVGDVTLEAGSSVWFGAILRGDNDRIVIGEGSNVQDGAVLHTDEGLALIVESDVTIGHQAMLHGCRIGEGSLIGIQAVILNRAVVGKNCLIGAQSLVPEGMVIPDGSLVLGSPAKVRRELSPDEIRKIREGAAHYREKALQYAQMLLEQGDGRK